jgi:Domain of unknown function(DUF2779)
MTESILTRSQYLSGLQCERKLWLDLHAPEQNAPTPEAQQHIYRMCESVRAAGRNLFPAGVLVTAARDDHEIAFDQTHALIADRSIPVILGAAFEFEGIRVRVDALERMGVGSARFGIRMFKSSTCLRESEHLPELEIQRWVLEHCGLSISSVDLVHVNEDFVRGEGPIHPGQFFKRVEVIERLGPVQMAAVGVRLDAMREVLIEESLPTKEPGAFCRRKDLCGYWDSCTATKPATWFVDRPGPNEDRKAIMVEVADSQKTWVSESLAEEIRAIRSPFWSLDIAAIGPSIPLFEGTRPYQPIPFRWSACRRSEDGSQETYELLASGRADPRQEFVTALIEAVGRDDAPILVYSGYVQRRLKELGVSLPDWAASLNAVAARLVDLSTIMRRNVYHPDFLGSYALDHVAPALISDFECGEVVVEIGAEDSMAAYVRLVSGGLRASEEAEWRRSALKAGARSAATLCDVYQALGRLANEPGERGRKRSPGAFSQPPSAG